MCIWNTQRVLPFRTDSNNSAFTFLPSNVSYVYCCHPREQSHTFFEICFWSTRGQNDLYYSSFPIVFNLFAGTIFKFVNESVDIALAVFDQLKIACTKGTKLHKYIGEVFLAHFCGEDFIQFCISFCYKRQSPILFLFRFISHWPGRWQETHSSTGTKTKRAIFKKLFSVHDRISLCFLIFAAYLSTTLVKYNKFGGWKYFDART